MGDYSTAAARVSKDASTARDAPALTRGLAVLRALATSPAPLSAAELATLTGAPRATLYRLLRTLIAEGFARPSDADASRYAIGPALSHLAGAHAPARTLADAARPAMDALARALGETVKLVVRDGLTALTVAVSIPQRDSCIASRVGTRLPLHVGASQRLLLAHAPADVQRRVVAGPLARVTPRTITSSRRLLADLRTLGQRRELASHGEGVEGVGATAVLLGPSAREPVGAVVAVYVHASQTPRTLARIRKETVAAAHRIDAVLADTPALVAAMLPLERG